MSTLEPPPPTAVRRELFVPPDWRGEDAETVWGQIRLAGGFLPTTDRKIQRLVRRHWSGTRIAEVGHVENDGERDWLTIAIYEPADEKDPFMVAILRMSDGKVVQRNPPVLVRPTDVIEVVDFLVPGS